MLGGSLPLNPANLHLRVSLHPTSRTVSRGPSLPPSLIEQLVHREASAVLKAKGKDRVTRMTFQTDTSAKDGGPRVRQQVHRLSVRAKPGGVDPGHRGTDGTPVGGRARGHRCKAVAVIANSSEAKRLGPD